MPELHRELKGYATSAFSYTTTVPACVDAAQANEPYPSPYYGLTDVATKPYTTNDNPGSRNYAMTMLVNITSADGTTKMGTVTEHLVRLSLNATFSDWCCIVAGPFSASFPATAGWSINVGGDPQNGSGDLGVEVTPGGGGGQPITSGYTANQYLNNEGGIDQPSLNIQGTQQFTAP